MTVLQTHTILETDVSVSGWIRYGEGKAVRLHTGSITKVGLIPLWISPVEQVICLTQFRGFFDV